MTLGDFLERVKGLPPDATLCTAELDEAYAFNIAAVEIVEDARVESRTAEGKEAIELANGETMAIVLRT
jgi:hypothetical protein